MYNNWVSGSEPPSRASGTISIMFSVHVHTSEHTHATGKRKAGSLQAQRSHISNSALALALSHRRQS